MIETLQQADEALREMAELDARKEGITAQCDAEINEVKARYAEQLVVKVGRSKMPLADRYEQLGTELQEFGSNHPELVMEGDKKSVKLNHGSLGFKSAPAKLVALEDEKTLLKSLAAKVMPALLKALDLVKLLTGFDSSKILSIDVKLDKAGLLKAWKDNVLPDERLAKIGLKVEQSGDEFWSKPDAKSVRSLPTA